MNHLLFAVCLSLCSSAIAVVAATDQISGIITDYDQIPVKGAVVKLASASIVDTTDENGTFRIKLPSTGIKHAFVSAPEAIPFTIQNNNVIVKLLTAQTVNIELLSTNGRLVQHIFSGHLNAGSSNFTFKELYSSSLFILRCRVGKQEFTCKISAGSVHFGTSVFQTSQHPTLPENTRNAAISSDSGMDMLEIRHPSFTVQKYLFNPCRDSVIKVAICSIEANWITELDSMYIDQDIFATGLSNGNYMAMGQIHSIRGDYDLSFFTLDPTGTVLTKNVYGSIENDLGFELFQQKNNNLRLFGDMWYTATKSDCDLFTMSVSPEGDSIDSKIFIDTNEVMGGHGAITLDGGYVIAGHRDYIEEHRGSVYIPQVTRIASDGTVLWTKEYPWPYYFSCNSDIIALSGGEFVLTGDSYDDTTSDYSIWLMKIDANGTMINKTLLKNKRRPWARQICETNDKKLFLLGKNEINDSEFTWIARFSGNCALEWDTTLHDYTKSFSCMTQLKNGSFLIAYNKILKGSAFGIPEKEAIGLLQMKTDGTVIKDIGPIPHFGHPRSISIGKDNSILVSSEYGYTFLQQKFFLINLTNLFER
jgi:hypothetical protein